MKKVFKKPRITTKRLNTRVHFISILKIMVQKLEKKKNYYIAVGRVLMVSGYVN